MLQVLFHCSDLAGTDGKYSDFDLASTVGSCSGSGFAGTGGRYSDSDFDFAGTGVEGLHSGLEEKAEHVWSATAAAAGLVGEAG